MKYWGAFNGDHISGCICEGAFNRDEVLGCVHRCASIGESILECLHWGWGDWGAFTGRAYWGTCTRNGISGGIQGGAFTGDGELGCMHRGWDNGVHPGGAFTRHGRLGCMHGGWRIGVHPVDCIHWGWRIGVHMPGMAQRGAFTRDTQSSCTHFQLPDFQHPPNEPPPAERGAHGRAHPRQHRFHRRQAGAFDRPGAVAG